MTVDTRASFKATLPKPVEAEVGVAIRPNIQRAPEVKFAPAIFSQHRPESNYFDTVREHQELIRTRAVRYMEVKAKVDALGRKSEESVRSEPVTDAAQRDGSDKVIAKPVVEGFDQYIETLKLKANELKELHSQNDQSRTALQAVSEANLDASIETLGQLADNTAIHAKGRSEFQSEISAQVKAQEEALLKLTESKEWKKCFGQELSFWGQRERKAHQEDASLDHGFKYRVKCAVEDFKKKPGWLRKISGKQGFYDDVAGYIDRLDTIDQTTRAMDTGPGYIPSLWSENHNVSQALSGWIHQVLREDIKSEPIFDRGLLPPGREGVSEIYRGWARNRMLQAYAGQELPFSESVLFFAYGLILGDDYKNSSPTFRMIDDLLIVKSHQEWQSRYSDVISSYKELFATLPMRFYSQDYFDRFQGEYPSPLATLQGENLSIGAIQFLITQPDSRVILPELLGLNDYYHRFIRGYFAGSTGEALGVKSYPNLDRVTESMMFTAPDLVTFAGVIETLAGKGKLSVSTEPLFNAAVLWARQYKANPEAYRLTDEQLKALPIAQQEQYRRISSGSYDFFIDVLYTHGDPLQLKEDQHYRLSNNGIDRESVFSLLHTDFSQKLASTDPFDRMEAFYMLGRIDHVHNIPLEVMLSWEVKKSEPDQYLIKSLLTEIKYKDQEKRMMTYKSYYRPPDYLKVILISNLFESKVRDVGVRVSGFSEAAANELVGTLLNLDAEGQLRVIEGLNLYLNACDRVGDTKAAGVLRSDEVVALISEYPDKASQLVEAVVKPDITQIGAERAVMVINFLKTYNMSNAAITAPLVESYSRIFTQQNAEEAAWVIGQYIGNKFIEPFTVVDVEFIHKYISEFGVLYTPSLFRGYQSLSKGEAPTVELEQLGITQTGSEGIKKLTTVVRETTNSFCTTATTEYNPQNPIIEDVIVALTHFKTSTFARQGEFSALQQRFQADLASGTIVVAPAEYQPGSISVRVLKEDKEFLFSAPAVERFTLLRGELLGAVKLAKLDDQAVVAESREGISSFSTQASERLQTQRQALEERLTAQNITDPARREAAARGLDRSIQRLSEMQEQLKNASSPTMLISVLAEYGAGNQDREMDTEVSAVLRQLLFREAIKINPNFGADPRNIEGVLGSGQPLTTQAVLRMMEVIQTGVKFEAMQSITLPKQAERYITKRVLDTGVFEDEIKQAQQIAEGQTQSFALYPGRNLLTELSGYYSDACWTREQDIVRNNPNLIGFPYVRTVNGVATLAGGCLIIETTLKNGEKAAIIRGINPRENIIRGLHAGDFFEKTVDAIEDWSKKRGIKNIVAPQGGSGALSNRPTLNSYVTSQYHEMAPLGETVNFNNYDITNKCLLVRRVAS